MTSGNEKKIIIPEMHPANHKTIFILDHTPYFGSNCESLIEFDFTKSRGPGFIPLAPIAKSLWTCSVEAAIEYCRIVWDLFPSGKLIRFIVSDSKAHCLNSWSPTQQSLSHLLNGLATVGVPPQDSQSTTEFSVYHGFQAAVQAMCECSEQQHEKRTSLNENTSSVVNRCRVICVTSVPDNEGLKIIEEKFQEELIQGNKVASSSDLLIPVDHCELIFLNIQPNLVDNIPSHMVSNMLVSETHHVKASGGLANKLSCLILLHYDLASTTVTGIPMKEEQNASSSANYDVEIFHSAKAHDALLKGCGVEIEQIRTHKEGFEYSTVTLKWCTPRGCTAAEMHNCTAMHRITPVDVNSRPSSCLINFLLGGRSVMLEVIRRGGTKALSHLLAAHAGQIYMHSLAISRSLHEDPPSISEGAGGRVTDYRITDFGLFMQQNKLAPMKGGKAQGTTLKKTRERLDRHTKFWPMTISSTVIFNYKQYMEPILNLMLLAELKEADVMQCKQCIYSLIGLEAKHEPLHTTSGPSQRGKGPKREEQYRQMWAELESFLRAHCVTDKHINILNCLLEVRSKDSASCLNDKVELDQALRELDQLSSSGGSNGGSGSEQRASVIRATTDSPLSPDASPTVTGTAGSGTTLSHHHRTPSSSSHQSSKHLHHHSHQQSAKHQTRSILELWVAKFCRQKSRQEFAGLSTSEVLPNGRLKAKLYPNLNKQDKRKPHRTVVE